MQTSEAPDVQKAGADGIERPGAEEVEQSGVSANSSDPAEHEQDGDQELSAEDDGAQIRNLDCLWHAVVCQRCVRHCAQKIRLQKERKKEKGERKEKQGPER